MNAHSAAAVAQERLVFERLCGLRALYADRASLDRTGVIGIADAIVYAEATLRADWRRAASPAAADRSADSTV